jgi:uncharacterized integral membrane protein (TIGR00697 family)
MSRVVIVIAAYIAAQMIADVTSLKIAIVAGMSIDAGTFVYPITFTLRDMVHKTIGIKAARVLILTAAAINVVMALTFWFAAKLPPDMEVGAQSEFSVVLSPIWRIVFASIVAEVIAELIDGETYQLWVKRVGKRWQWGRVLVSNAVSVPLDSALFCAIAFYGTMPDAIVWSIFLTNVLVKGATTVVSVPLIYAVPDSTCTETAGGYGIGTEASQWVDRQN